MAQKNVKDVAMAGIAELAKRVPPSQSIQFQAFQAKHTEYQNRVRKQPEKLPPIDWEFYRLNVRPEAKKWVDEFQQKYKAICDSFDERCKQDYSKYYVELDKVRCEMQEEIDKFKCESNGRIKALEEEYERIKALKPYSEMTMEEYCDLLPEKKMFLHEGRPSFWPHTEDEQSLEPPARHSHNGHNGHDDSDGHGEPPKGSSGGDGGHHAAAGSASSSPSAGNSNAEGTKTKNSLSDKKM